MPNSVILILPDIKYEEYIDESSYFEPESQLKIKCLENYVLSGHNILTCLENGKIIVRYQIRRLFDS